MALYTPFVEKSVTNLSNAYLGKQQRQQEDQEKRLFGQAYMGDQGAMQQLAQVRPDLAMQVEQANRQRQQDTMSTQAAQTKGQQEQHKVLGGILENAAKFGTFEEAQAYTAREAQGAGLGDIPPLTEEAYNQAKTVYGEQPEGADIGAASPKDFTVESMAQYEATGDRGVLKRYTPPDNVGDRERQENELAARLEGSTEDPLGMAQDLISGRLSAKVNEKTGTVQLIDEVAAARGEEAVTELPMSVFADKPELPEGQESLYNLTEKATGIASGVKAGASRAFGQFGAPIATETLEARQTLRTVSSDLIRALSINPRFPVAEIERIKQETNLEAGLFNSPGAMQADMRSLDRSLKVRADQARSDASNTSLPETVRADQAANANSIDNFLVQLGVPTEISVSELDSPEAVAAHNTEDLKIFLRNMTEKQFKQLSEETKAAIKQRIQ